MDGHQMMHDYDRRQAAKAAPMTLWFRGVLVKLLAKHKADIEKGAAPDEYEVESMLEDKPHMTDPEVIAAAKAQFAKNFDWGGLLSKEGDAFAKGVNNAIIRKVHLAGDDAPDWDPLESGLAIVALKLYGESFEYDERDPFSRVEHPGHTDDRRIDDIVRKELGGQPRHGGFTTVRWSLEQNPSYAMDDLVYTVSAEWVVGPKDGAELLKDFLGSEFDKRVHEALTKVREEKARASV